jgi:alpha-tubulin suppressor-like RCC1 family protein
MAGSDVTPVIISDEVALDADGISVATSVGNNAALVIGGALASGGSVTNVSAHPVTILSSGNDIGISFDIVGTDANGTALTENLAGQAGYTSNSIPTTSAGYFKTITSITAVGTPAANVSAGINADEHSPVEIVSSGVAEVYAAEANCFYTTSSGALYGWGSNAYGQLGLGTGTNAGYPYGTTNSDTTSRLTPTLIVSQGVTHVATGGSHTLFVKSPFSGIPGQLWSMGSNGHGRALNRFGSSGGSDPRQFTGIHVHP